MEGLRDPSTGSMNGTTVIRVITACCMENLSSDCCLQRLIKYKLNSSACSARYVNWIARASSPLARWCFWVAHPMARPVCTHELLPVLWASTSNFGICMSPKLKEPHLLTCRWFQIEYEQAVYYPHIVWKVRMKLPVFSLPHYQLLPLVFISFDISKCFSCQPSSSSRQWFKHSVCPCY